MTWLSSKNPAAVLAGAEPGATAALVPVLGLRDLTVPKQSSLLSGFSVSSTILASNLHICWDTIGCSFCSSEDQQGVPPVGRGKWTPLPPISPSSSQSSTMEF